MEEIKKVEDDKTCYRTVCCMQKVKLEYTTGRQLRRVWYCAEEDREQKEFYAGLASGNNIQHSKM